MTFFRIKKINGKEYAYIVENKWKGNSSKQKVKGYLGRVYRFDEKNNVEFLTFNKIENLEFYIKETQIKKIFSDLAEWELFKLGVIM